MNRVNVDPLHIAKYLNSDKSKAFDDSLTSIGDDLDSFIKGNGYNYLNIHTVFFYYQNWQF